MYRSLGLCFALSLSVSPAFGQIVSGAPDAPVAGAQSGDTLGILNQRLSEVEFENAPLELVVDWIAEFTGMNIVTRWQVLEDQGIDRDKPITMHLRNLRLAEILWMLMNEAGGTDTRLAYRASGNLLIFSSEEDLNREMVTKIYDVSDLLARVPNFSGPDIDITQAGQSGQGGTQGPFSQSDGMSADERPGDQLGEESIDDLIRLILEVVEPDSWAVNGGGVGTIHAFNNQLVVRNSIRVHQLLGGYVDEGD